MAQISPSLCATRTFQPRFRAGFSILLLAMTMLLPNATATAQDILNFGCNQQAGADAMVVDWNVNDTCGPFANLTNILLFVDGNLEMNTMAPQGNTVVGPLVPGEHIFRLEAICSSGAPDIEVCSGIINCNPLGMITNLTCNVGPAGQVDLTWTLPSSYPPYYNGMFVTVDGVITVNTNSGSPVLTLPSLLPGPHVICLETPILGSWSCGQMACCNVTVPGSEICNNGIDDDNDMLIDCADPDCAGDPACATGPCSGQTPGIPCDDGDPCTIGDTCDGNGNCIGNLLDADLDGVCDFFDICPGFDDNLDADFDGVPDGCDQCPGFDDNVDTDFDGVADGCDCGPQDGTVYPGATEICDNNVDDDCDTAIDCADPDCANDPVCTGGIPCTQPLDCDDSDPCTIDECLNGFCVYTPIPNCGATELCNNGIDDDGDMLIDCADPDCATDPACQQGTCSITNIAVGCDAAGGPGSYTISFDVINDTPFDVTHIYVPGVIPGAPGTTLAPTVTSFNPPLLPGTSGTVLLSLAGGSPFLNFCFPVGLMAIDDATGNLFQCCATDVCVELPPCESCLQISNEDGSWGAATFGYELTLTNLAGTPPAIAEYAYVVPVTPGITVDVNWFPLGGLADGLSAAISTNISGGVPNQEVCFLITIHDATLGECCGFVHCFTLPPFLLPPGVPFMRGDANSDGSFNIADVITSLDFLFHSLNVPCVQALDSNDDESVDIADAVFSLAALFAGGAEPSPPGSSCGVDVTPGTLQCQSFPACDTDDSNP